jgi:hypothetical protein
LSREEVLSSWYEKAKKEGRLWRQKNPEKYSVYHKRYRNEHRDKLKMYGKEYYSNRLGHYRDLRQVLKREVLKIYGGVCRCCGEDRVEFLTIHHVDNNGAEHRLKVWGDVRRGGGTTFYYWLRRNGYPSGFEVLCFNCNCALGFYGYCPHQKGEKI